MISYSLKFCRITFPDLIDRKKLNFLLDQYSMLHSDDAICFLWISNDLSYLSKFSTTKNFILLHGYYLLISDHWISGV